MKILVIGSGGREHAIAWKLANEGHQVFGAPGNPGIAQVGEVVPTHEYIDVAREKDHAAGRDSDGSVPADGG